MSNPGVQKGLRLFLAASLLAATTITAPSVVHCHSGGQRPHEHDLGHRGLGRWDWSDGSGTPAAAAADHRDHHLAAAGDDLHRHVLLVFLGRAVPLGGPDQPDGSRQGSPADLGLLWTLRDHSQVLNSPGGPHLPAWSTSAVAPCGGDRVVGQQAGPPCKAAPVPPLCDRARHERSGVQLA